MYNLSLKLENAETMQQELLDALPSAEEARGAMIKLEFTYPHEWESMFSEKELRERVRDALDFRLKRNPVYSSRIRIQDRNISSLTPSDLLKAYCLSVKMTDSETDAILPLAEEIFSRVQKQKE